MPRAKLLRRVEFHYTPKHASWLNMAEIEIGILSRQCLDRRIDSRHLLRTEVDAWQHARSAPYGTTAYTLRHSVISDLVHDGLDLLTVTRIPADPGDWAQLTSVWWLPANRSD